MDTNTKDKDYATQRKIDEVNTNTYDNSMDEFENIEEYYAIKKKEKQNEKKVTTKQTWDYATEVSDGEIEDIIK
tara:strand:- start:4 stop:225 length:222 start_codon:yes stop_codon:yes gene_type:complete